MIKCFDEIILTITLYTRYMCVGIVYLQCRSYTLNLQVFIICQLTLIRNRIKRSLIDYLVALCITVQCGVQCSTYYNIVLYRCLYSVQKCAQYVYCTVTMYIGNSDARSLMYLIKIY